MLHLGSTLLVSFTLYLSILDSLNEILKKISVIIYRKWQYAQRRFNRMETFFYFAGFRWRILWSMSMPVPEGGQTVPLPDLWRGVPQRVCPGHYRCTPIPRIHHRTSQHQNRLELSGLCQLYTHVLYLSIAFVYVFSPVYTISKPSFLFKIDNQ